MACAAADAGKRVLDRQAGRPEGEQTCLISAGFVSFQSKFQTRLATVTVASTDFQVASTINWNCAAQLVLWRCLGTAFWPFTLSSFHQMVLVHVNVQCITV